ncbi:TMM70 protein, partial [Polypterus senegalus]
MNTWRSKEGNEETGATDSLIWAGSQLRGKRGDGGRNSTSHGDRAAGYGCIYVCVKFFSYSSSMFSICVAPYLFLKTGIGVDSLALQVVFCGIIGFFTFLTPVLLHMITKGYVVRLYHSPQTDIYTAVTYSALLSETKTVFHQKDVQVPDVSKMFTSFYAKKKSMLVNPMLFEVPSDYSHLMGFDKPFLFDLEELQFQDKRKEE